MGVSEDRVEPFAHPILLERARIAELGRMAHPVREDGPATLTLFEILATAFAARGHSLTEATWDAYRIKGEPWTIRLSWTAGLTENEAEWTLKQSMGSPDTVVARNTVAADLTDPDFMQPVRSLTPVGLGLGDARVEAIDAREERDVDDADVPDLANEGDVADELSQRRRTRRSFDDDSPVVSTRDDLPSIDVTEPTDAPAGGPAGEEATDGAAEGEGDDFLQNPDPEPKPKRRRRKAVTPAWEDVLLGVRANTKRPRD